MKVIWADQSFSFLRPWAFCLTVLLAALISLPGCGGCRKKDEKTKAQEEAERLEKERQKKKPDFEINLPVSMPADEKPLGCRAKPGHWAAVTIETIANRGDFVGDLNLTVVDEKGKPIGLDAVPYTVTDSRDIALSKERPKELYSSFFAPPFKGKFSGSLNLVSRGSGFGLPKQTFTVSRMFAHQYHFAVLARTPERYAYIRGLDSIKPPKLEPNPIQDYHYWVSLVKADKDVSLPEDALLWTSTAYILWDDVEPKTLTPQQQKAMLDWLHWGGQLIISGPDTLETLRDSFLADYLPAKADGPWKLTQGDFDDLNATFTMPGQKPLTVSGEWSGVRLKLADDARYAPGTGGLVAERRVGRGRVVATAMRLSDRPVTSWKALDHFFNACLLRRPARRITKDGKDYQVDWADTMLRTRPYDPTVNSQLRYFSRDAGVTVDEYTELDQTYAKPEPPSSLPTPSPLGALPPTHQDDGPDGMGVAAWRNFSPVANEARNALRNAACVEVPDRWFIIWVIAVYLAVLVPLNWFIFAMLGRTEWAWVAAPIIAIVGTVAVVHVARLNIGFARSEANVAVLEIQGDYDRAHLANYAALYTSLTTRYAFRDENGNAMIQPFPRVSNHGEFRLLPGQGLDTLVCRHEKDLELRGFYVPSNLVDFVHSEEMVDLKGKLYAVHNNLGGWTVTNQTGIPLYGVGVIRKDDGGQIETAWIGELGGITHTDVTFSPPAASGPTWWEEQRDDDPKTGKRSRKGEVNLRRLMELAEKPDDLQPGDMRLIGWAKEAPSTVTASPAAPQSKQAVLVVAHLRHGLGGGLDTDVNSRAAPAKYEPPPETPYP